MITPPVAVVYRPFGRVARFFSAWQPRAPPWDAAARHGRSAAGRAGGHGLPPGFRTS